MKSIIKLFKWFMMIFAVLLVLNAMGVPIDFLGIGKIIDSMITAIGNFFGGLTGHAHFPSVKVSP